MDFDPMGWRMALQLFAEDGQEGGDDGSDHDGDGQQEDAKTYSEEDVRRMIDDEAEKRVKAALTRQKKEFEKQAKRSGMEEAQRTLAEKDDRIAELEEQLRERNLLGEKNRVMTALSERGISAALADAILIEDDSDANDERLDKLQTAFNRAVEDAVKQRLAGKPPAKGEGKPAGMTRAQFKKLGLREQQALAEKDIELYKRMTKEEE